MIPPSASLPIEVNCRSVHAAQSASESFLLIDCREPNEYAIAKIEGAVLIPMRDLPQRTVELGPPGDRQIVIHCHHGGRSLKAANWLRQNGFPQAQSMAGGIDAWALEIDPKLARY